MTNGWEESAAAWIADMGQHGDFGRRYDPVMLPRALAARPATVLDVGCGEGPRCRSRDRSDAQFARGTAAGSDREIRRSRSGVASVRRRFVQPRASYLSLIDIPDVVPAIAEMVRVLRPGGRLLVANLNGFNTAGVDIAWSRDEHGNKKHYPIDHYLQERSTWLEYRGIRILNYHRPLSTYMRLLLEHGLRLTHFDEPAPTADAPAGAVSGAHRPSTRAPRGPGPRCRKLLSRARRKH